MVQRAAAQAVPLNPIEMEDNNGRLPIDNQLGARWAVGIALGMVTIDVPLDLRTVKEVTTRYQITQQDDCLVMRIPGQMLFECDNAELKGRGTGRTCRPATGALGTWGGRSGRAEHHRRTGQPARRGGPPASNSGC